MFAALGVRVTIIDKRPVLLPFLDHEISTALTYIAQQHNVLMRLGEEVAAIEVLEDANKPVEVRLKSGKVLHAEAALYSIGRVGATARLELQNAGVTFPSLASTSYEQGRAAARHAFGLLKEDADASIRLFPYGIYTVPEISTIGKNEDELTQAGKPYEIGKAYYREIARGQILGDRTGLLKLIFNPEDRKLLGVHIIGEQASELVHIGQAVMALGGTIDYFCDAVFNFPTLGECYKTAALDGLNRMSF
jgi:NAD(P) transhydrogenase